MRKSGNATPPYSIPQDAIPAELLSIGFTTTFLSSIRKNPIRSQHELDTITVPLKNQEVINNIVGLVKANPDNQKPLFTPRNISSIFHGIGGGGLIEAAEALFLSKDEILELMKPIRGGGLGFTSENISSILNGAGIFSGQIVNDLFAKKDEIFTLMKPTNEGGLGFTSANISSILSGVGKNLPEAVDALSISKDKIAELIKSKEDGGLGFTPTNISSILNRVGKDAGKAVEFLFSNKDDIRDLIKPIDEGGFNFNSQNRW